MNVYKNILYSEKPGDETLLYNDRVYYRYMDKLYIPNHPSQLSQDDVSALSEIRIKLNGEVIDYSYTKEVILSLFEKIPPQKTNNIIDFGCGGGILGEVASSNENLKIKKVIGLDLCELAVKTSRSNYDKSGKVEYFSYLFNGEKNIPLDDSSIDSVISSFVMHFPILENQLEELYRVIKPGGYFVYNDYIYHKFPGHTKKIISRLKKIGFDITETTTSFKHPDTLDLKNHKLVTAIKI